jgi:hypothetical protein
MNPRPEFIRCDLFCIIQREQVFQHDCLIDGIKSPPPLVMIEGRGKQSGPMIPPNRLNFTIDRLTEFADGDELFSIPPGEHVTV